jgi:hypothetical protein
MDLTLFIIFFILSLIIIFLGFYRTEHSELALVGFVFLFLLSFLIIGNDIQYKTGVNTTTLYTYDNATLNSTTEVSTDMYSPFTATSGFSHSFGYWLAVASIIGFVGVIVGLGRGKI